MVFGGQSVCLHSYIVIIIILYIITLFTTVIKDKYLFVIIIIIILAMALFSLVLWCVLQRAVVIHMPNTMGKGLHMLESDSNAIVIGEQLFQIS